MKYIILIIFICIWSTEAQYQSIIPCKTDESCKNILNITEVPRCIKGICMCANTTAKSLQMCEFKDVIVNSKPRVIRKDCLQDQDCEYIRGARCHEDYSDKSKKTCVCPPHTIIGTHEPKCLAVATEPSSMCIESSQCVAGLDNADCVDGKCRCRVNFHFSLLSERCNANKVYGEACNKQEDNCFQLDRPNGKNSLLCSDENKCECLKNYVYVDDLCQFSDASRTVLDISLIMVVVIFTIKIF